MQVKGKVQVIYDTEYQNWGELYLRLKVKFRLPGEILSRNITKTLTNYRRSDKYNNNKEQFLKECLACIADKKFLKEEAERMLLNELIKWIKNNKNADTASIVNNKIKELNKEDFIIEVEILS